MAGTWNSLGLVGYLSLYVVSGFLHVVSPCGLQHGGLDVARLLTQWLRILRVSITKPHGGSCKAFCDLVLEVRQHYSVRVGLSEPVSLQRGRRQHKDVNTGWCGSLGEGVGGILESSYHTESLPRLVSLTSSIHCSNSSQNEDELDFSQASTFAHPTPISFSPNIFFLGQLEILKKISIWS